MLVFINIGPHVNPSLLFKQNKNTFPSLLAPMLCFYTIIQIKFKVVPQLEVVKSVFTSI